MLAVPNTTLARKTVVAVLYAVAFNDLHIVSAFLLVERVSGVSEQR